MQALVAGKAEADHFGRVFIAPGTAAIDGAEFAFGDQVDPFRHRCFAAGRGQFDDGKGDGCLVHAAIFAARTEPETLSTG